MFILWPLCLNANDLYTYYEYYAIWFFSPTGSENTRQKVSKSGYPDRITMPTRCLANGTVRRGLTRPPEYLGVVTSEGKVKTRSMGVVRTDYECGNISMLYGIAEKTVIPVLKEIYSAMWERIISYVFLRNI